MPFQIPLLCQLPDSKRLPICTPPSLSQCPELTTIPRQSWLSPELGHLQGYALLHQGREVRSYSSCICSFLWIETLNAYAHALLSPYSYAVFVWLAFNGDKEAMLYFFLRPSCLLTAIAQLKRAGQTERKGQKAWQSIHTLWFLHMTDPGSQRDSGKWGFRGSYS